MLLSSDSDVVEGLRSTTLFGFGLIEDQIDGIGSYFNLHEVNRELRIQNTELAYKNFQLQNALLENIRLRQLLEFRDQSKLEFIPARIIGSSPLSFVNGYLLAVTGGSPVRKNSAVVTAKGLVGKIIKVSSNKALCQILMGPNARVSVRIQRNRELGIVGWDGTAGLQLDHISNTIDVRVGDVLYTSGLSQIYPANIKVGVVAAVKKNNDALFQSIKVLPAVNFNSLEEVAIVLPQSSDEI